MFVALYYNKYLSFLAQPAQLWLVTMNEIVEYVDFNKICRLCLRKTDISPYFRLNTKHIHSNQNISFTEVLEKHVKFKISKEDNKPQNVCNPCVSQLFQSYHFFEMCVLSNNILDEALRHRNSNNKLEFIDLVKNDSEDRIFASRANSTMLVDDESAVNQFEYNVEQFDNNDNKAVISEDCKSGFDFINYSLSGYEEEIILKTEDNKANVANIESMTAEEHNYNITVNDIHKNRNNMKNLKTKKIRSPIIKEPKLVSIKRVMIPRKKRIMPRKSQFNCLICKEIFATFKDVIDHFDNIHEGCTRCIICDKLIRNKSTKLLKYHMNTHRRRNTRFDCKKCFQYFLTRTELEEHYKSKEHNSDPRVCKICNKTFKKKVSLMVHMSSHTKEKKNQCSKCGECFRYSGNLSRHIRVTHKGVRFLCSFCGKVFTAKVTLNLHIRTVHEGDKSARKRVEKQQCGDDSITKKCEICQEEFKTFSALKRHGAMRHKSVHEYKCVKCCEVFPSSKARSAHMYMVHYNHKCPYCDRGYASEDVFKEHVKLHKNPGYTKCIQCNLQCKTQIALKLHMNTHTGDRPYKCDDCDKAFKQRAHLRYHQFLHTRKKPFECHLCKKTFGLQSSLQSHLNVHEGKKPFTCDLCDKAYTEKGTLTKHIKKMHG